MSIDLASHPEVFVAKGRDGKTDIWGIICRPAKFDPARKYPVLEQVYAGPQSSYVPKSFSGVRRFASLTDLGFVVVQADGMGTANRSKAFHDVAFKNLGDADVIVCYLLPESLARLQPKLDAELKKGARVVSYAFQIGDWKPAHCEERNKTLNLAPIWVYHR